jgi:hypothetical protein
MRPQAGAWDRENESSRRRQTAEIHARASVAARRLRSNEALVPPVGNARPLESGARLSCLQTTHSTSIPQCDNSQVSANQEATLPSPPLTPPSPHSVADNAFLARPRH